MAHAFSTAASTPRPRYGAAVNAPHGPEAGRRAKGFAGTHSGGAANVSPVQNGEAGSPANLPNVDLPIWASTDEAKALLVRIIEEQPERTKPLTQTMTGGIASFGYRGKAANALRTLFSAFEADRLDWVAECEFNSPGWHKRRNALISYGKTQGPDAVIERVLKAAA